MKAHVVTLGCPKNLVDSEAAVTRLRGAGCEITDDPAGADLLLVAACSFLESSWRETTDEIARLAEYKKSNDGARLILMGCLPRHRDENLEKTLPWVDHFLPTGAQERLEALVDLWRRRETAPRTINGTGTDRFAGFENRVLLTPRHTAYVKIAEGCDRRCTFCAIPIIRGPQSTRPVSSVVEEVAGMVERGVREVTLLAQDVASYRNGGDDLGSLVEAIDSTGIDWIRIFYLHPAGLDLNTVERLFSVPAVVRYLEIPVQHASNGVLKRMGRSHDRGHVEGLVGSVRARYPGVVIRSEVIVGFPGETEDDFEELKEMVEELEFESLGVFPYSREPGTAAAALDGVLPEPIVRERVEELTSVQEAISFSANSSRIGEVYEVLVDRELDAQEGAIDGCSTAGRFYGQAPEIDGEVFIRGEGVVVGDFIETKITESGIFDLVGELVG